MKKQKMLPNIVFMIADDLGYGDLECYNAQSKIPTPNLNQLAADGRRFTDVYSPSSVCTPTRYGLMTGRYCWRTPFMDVSLWAWDPALLEAERLTLPQMLKEQGYATAVFGKWHLGWDWPLQGGGYISDEVNTPSVPEEARLDYGRRIDFQRPIGHGPTARGFDYFFGVDTSNCPPYCFIENDRTVGIPSVWAEQGVQGVLTKAYSTTAVQYERAHPGPALPAWDVTTIMPVITQQAIQYIEKQDQSQPFFAYIPFTAPHTPIAPSTPFLDKSQAGRYGDFVHQLDWSVGQIRAALERNGLADNTLLIMTSDHGSPHRDGTNMTGALGSLRHHGHDASHPWRGIKSEIWEGGSRVPFIAYWPNGIAGASVCHEPIALVDMMRTFATLVDHDLPETSAEDSFDVSAALLGQAAPHSRDHIILHSASRFFAIRQGNWKLILGQGSGSIFRGSDPDGPAGQLYDLAKDPQEQYNLYNEYPEKVASLTQRLEEIQQQGRSYVA